MQISVTGRHMEIQDSIRDYAQDKAGKLIRYYDRIERIEIILDHEAKNHKAEIVVHADHKNTLVAHADGEEYCETIDLVIDKMERQLTKHKEKYRNHKHPSKPEAG